MLLLRMHLPADGMLSEWNPIDLSSNQTIQEDGELSGLSISGQIEELLRDSIINDTTSLTIY